MDGGGQEIPFAHTTPGECVRSTGYDCCGTGKWHNGRTSCARSFSCGDGNFFGGMGDHGNGPAGRYGARRPYVAAPFGSNRTDFRTCDHGEAGKHSADLVVDAAIRLIEGYFAQPFFRYVSLRAPRDFRTMPERFPGMYDPATIGLPGNFLPERPIDTGALRIRGELVAAFPRDPNEIKRHIAE